VLFDAATRSAYTNDGCHAAAIVFPEFEVDPAVVAVKSYMPMIGGNASIEPTFMNLVADIDVMCADREDGYDPGWLAPKITEFFQAKDEEHLFNLAAAATDDEDQPASVRWCRGENILEVIKDENGKVQMKLHWQRLAASTPIILVSSLDQGLQGQSLASCQQWGMKSSGGESSGGEPVTIDSMVFDVATQSITVKIGPNTRELQLSGKLADEVAGAPCADHANSSYRQNTRKGAPVNSLRYAQVAFSWIARAIRGTSVSLYCPPMLLDECNPLELGPVDKFMTSPMALAKTKPKTISVAAMPEAEVNTLGSDFAASNVRCDLFAISVGEDSGTADIKLVYAGSSIVVLVGNDEIKNAAHIIDNPKMLMRLYNLGWVQKSVHDAKIFADAAFEVFASGGLQGDKAVIARQNQLDFSAGVQEMKVCEANGTTPRSASQMTNTAVHGLCQDMWGLHVASFVISSLVQLAATCVAASCGGSFTVPASSSSGKEPGHVTGPSDYFGREVGMMDQTAADANLAQLVTSRGAKTSTKSWAGRSRDEGSVAPLCSPPHVARVALLKNLAQVAAAYPDGTDSATIKLNQDMLELVAACLVNDPVTAFALDKLLAATSGSTVASATADCFKATTLIIHSLLSHPNVLAVKNSPMKCGGMNYWLKALLVSAKSVLSCQLRALQGVLRGEKAFALAETVASQYLEAREADAELRKMHAGGGQLQGAPIQPTAAVAQDAAVIETATSSTTLACTTAHAAHGRGVAAHGRGGVRQRRSDGATTCGVCGESIQRMQAAQTGCCFAPGFCTTVGKMHLMCADPGANVRARVNQPQLFKACSQCRAKVAVKWSLDDADAVAKITLDGKEHTAWDSGPKLATVWDWLNWLEANYAAANGQPVPQVVDVSVYETAKRTEHYGTAGNELIKEEIDAQLEAGGQKVPSNSAKFGVIMEWAKSQARLEALQKELTALKSVKSQQPAAAVAAATATTLGAKHPTHGLVTMANVQQCGLVVAFSGGGGGGGDVLLQSAKFALVEANNNHYVESDSSDSELHQFMNLTFETVVSEISANGTALTIAGKDIAELTIKHVVWETEPASLTFTDSNGDVALITTTRPLLAAGLSDLAGCLHDLLSVSGDGEDAVKINVTVAAEYLPPVAVQGPPPPKKLAKAKAAGVKSSTTNSSAGAGTKRYVGQPEPRWDDAETLLGRSVLKNFDGKMWAGTVIAAEMGQDETGNAEVWWTVKYTDDDGREGLNWAELRDVLQEPTSSNRDAVMQPVADTSAGPAAAAAHKAEDDAKQYRLNICHPDGSLHFSVPPEPAFYQVTKGENATLATVITDLGVHWDHLSFNDFTKLMGSQVANLSLWETITREHSPAQIWATYTTPQPGAGGAAAASTTPSHISTETAGVVTATRTTAAAAADGTELASQTTKRSCTGGGGGPQEVQDSPTRVGKRNHSEGIAYSCHEEDQGRSCGPGKEPWHSSNKQVQHYQAHLGRCHCGEDDGSVHT
jgi:hypothetical protein